MKTPVWSKADEKRALNMGWTIDAPDSYFVIQRHGDRFKSDDEAIEWVIQKICVESGLAGTIAEQPNGDTCRKALFLCAKG